MTDLGQTPSQTVGPYYSMALARPGENVLWHEDVVGSPVRVEGTVLDGDGLVIDDALIELWQANAAGRYRHPVDARLAVLLDPAFTGAGRAATELTSGLWWFTTVKPGPVPGPDGRPQAPHLCLVVQARGMLLPSFTRMYFPEDGDLLAADPILGAVPAQRRSTLVASLVAKQPVPTYRFDIRFQGDDETVFFDL